MDYYGVTLPDPPEGEMVLGAVVLLKVMKPSGEICYRECPSDQIHEVEMLGMASTFCDTMRSRLMGNVRMGRGMPGVEE